MPFAFADYAPKTAPRHGMKTRLRRVLVGAMLTVGLAGATFAQDEVPGRKKQIVVLYSYRTLMPINADWDRGIRRALAKELAQGVELNIEYLDLPRYQDAEYIRGWIVLLQKKYADRQVDLVMTVDCPALELILAHRAVLFPDIPIVFCSASIDLAERACVEPNVTGVAYRLDIAGTLRTALDIYPKAEHLLVICGGSASDTVFRDLVRSVVAQYEEPLDVDYLVGLPLPELLERIAGVDPHSVVLLLVYDKDASGNDYVTREVVEQVAAVCPAPVFGLWDTLLGHGIVGGDLTMIEAQGQLAGEMAARVLQGERPSDIPVAGLATNRLMFDARQLRRWGIREDILPEGSILRYREATFWEEHAAQCVGGLLILALQSVVIAGLLVNRARRRRAERALADRLRFESLLSDLSSRFVHLPPDRVDQEITHALGQIAKFLDVDGGSLFRVSTDGTELDVSHSWMKDSEHPAARIRLTEIPWIWGNIARKEVFRFTTVTDLPDEAQRERELFRRVGLKSAIAFPLSVSGTTIGTIAFGRLHEERGWDDATVRGLTLIGEVFANALAHAQAEEALRTSQTEARHLAGRLLTAQEDESKRLARELHDDLSQRLAATAIEAGKLEQQSAQSSESRARLCDLKNSLVAIADDVHQISRQIHPAILDDLGLADALQSECNGFGERHGHTVQLRCGDLLEDLPKDMALCLYRIVQEALRNVAKHAMTDFVEVVLRADPEFAYLEVRDLGHGFDPGEVQAKPGLGLASMEERVRLVGGELTVSSEPGRGTSIAVRIPLPEEDV